MKNHDFKLAFQGGEKTITVFGFVFFVAIFLREKFEFHCLYGEDVFM